MLIDLLRHGEPAGGERLRGSCDDPLSSQGWMQMRGVVGVAPPWDRIVSSPLRRCVEFARELATRYRLTLEIDERIREIYFGDWDGCAVKALLAINPDGLTRFWADPVANPPPKAERFDEFRCRILRAWTSLTRPISKDHILVVTHGGPIRTILGEVLGIDPRRLPRLEVPHAALSRIRVWDDTTGHVATSLVFHAGRI